MPRIEIEVDLEDAFAAIDDKQILAEAKRRRVSVPESGLDAVSTAIAQIRRGDTLDAITTLEREFWPKWASVEDSEFALRRAIRPANDNQLALAQEAAPEGAVAN